MLLNPRYGASGIVIMPYLWLVKVMGPLLELSGYVLLPLFAVTGLNCAGACFGHRDLEREGSVVLQLLPGEWQELVESVDPFVHAKEIILAARIRPSASWASGASAPCPCSGHR
jgi:hypothetical protein